MQTIACMHNERGGEKIVNYKHTNRLMFLTLILSMALIGLSTVNRVSASDSTIYVNDSSGNDEGDDLWIYAN